MKIIGTYYRSLWWDDAKGALQIIDQRWLPHELRIQSVESIAEYATAIVEMRVRGAPLIGAVAAYGMAVAMMSDPSDANLAAASETLNATRPTAINLGWALNRCRRVLRPVQHDQRAAAALQLAHEIADEDVEINRAIGHHGLGLIREIAARKPSGSPVQILIHCNPGWIATVDFRHRDQPDLSSP